MKKRYWLIGAISGLTIGAVILLVLGIVGLTAHNISDQYGLVAENVFNFFSNITLITFLSKEGFLFPESIIICLVYYFLIGAIIGSVYGKTKNRSPSVV